MPRCSAKAPQRLCGEVPRPAGVAVEAEGQFIDVAFQSIIEAGCEDMILPWTDLDAPLLYAETEVKSRWKSTERRGWSLHSTGRLLAERPSCRAFSTSVDFHASGSRCGRLGCTVALSEKSTRCVRFVLKPRKRQGWCCSLQAYLHCTGLALSDDSHASNAWVTPARNGAF